MNYDPNSLKVKPFLIKNKRLKIQTCAKSKTNKVIT